MWDEFVCMYTWACVSKCLCSFDCIHYHVIITMSTCVSFESVLIIKKYGSCINKKLSKIQLHQWFLLSKPGYCINCIYETLIVHLVFFDSWHLVILQTHFLYQKLYPDYQIKENNYIIIPLILFQRSTGINHD